MNPDQYRSRNRAVGRGETGNLYKEFTGIIIPSRVQRRPRQRVKFSTGCTLSKEMLWMLWEKDNAHQQIKMGSRIRGHKLLMAHQQEQRGLAVQVSRCGRKKITHALFHQELKKSVSAQDIFILITTARTDKFNLPKNSGMSTSGRGPTDSSCIG